MEKKDFFRQEDECNLLFADLGPCYHLCTSENAPVMFRNDNEFREAMNTVAFVSALFDDIAVLTFEIMSNHLHFALCGERERIMAWFQRLVSALKTNPDLKESRNAISSLQAKMFQIEDLENARNVISYINRNGFVADYNYTPFSYPWGANRFYFNDEAKCRYEELRAKATFRSRRQLLHTHLADFCTDLYLVDGYISPLCFCRIDSGEKLFRNAQHYFSKIAKSVEASSAIAKVIGESIYYLDSEIYSIISVRCSKEYGCKNPSMAPADAKIALAKTMRYDYNASVKQICRILKMDITIVSGLFPGV